MDKRQLASQFRESDIRQRFSAHQYRENDEQAFGQ